jgi:transcriptional regulator with XRE-family HTH domain/tetratricopeptide (TPR) repeat protein
MLIGVALDTPRDSAEDWVNQRNPLFGQELRKKRLTAGLSLAQLAQMVHYSKGQLSKVERGIKAPSRDLARLCDAALEAKGELTSLTIPRSANRRQVLTAGALAVPSIYLIGVGTYGGDEQTDLPGTFRCLFDHYRHLGQTTDPGILVPVLAAQVSVIEEIAKNSGKNTNRALLTLASRYAEYTGWLVQETGIASGALRWTQRAVNLANAAGDPDFAAYGLVRHALVSMYQGDAALTTQLAVRAQATVLPPRIRGLAAAREAQGHALAADYDSAMRALDRASALLNAANSDADHPVIGTGNVADPAQMTKGWCLYDLGRPREAARVIDEQLATIPPTATRAQARYGARRALAYAAAGDIDHACQLTTDLLDDVTRVRSATIATDLRALARTFRRHQKNSAVRDLSPGLDTALRIASHSDPSDLGKAPHG